MARFLPAVCLSLSLALLSACVSSPQEVRPYPGLSSLAEKEAALRDAAIAAFDAGDHRGALKILIEAESFVPDAAWVAEGLTSVTGLLLDEIVKEAEARRAEGSSEEAISILKDGYALLDGVLSEDGLATLAALIETWESLPFADHRSVDERSAFPVAGVTPTVFEPCMYSDDGRPLGGAVVDTRAEIQAFGGDPAFSSVLSPDLGAGATWSVLYGESTPVEPSRLRGIVSEAESLESALLEKGAVVLDRSTLANMKSEIQFSVGFDSGQLLMLQLAMGELADLYSKEEGLALGALSQALEAFANSISRFGAHGVLQGVGLPAESAPQVGRFHGAQISLLFGATQGVAAFEQSWDRFGASLERWEKVADRRVKDMSSSGGQLQISGAYSEAADGSTPMYFDPRSNSFWAHEKVFRSHLAGFAEYVEHKNSLLPETPRLACEACGADLGAGDEGDPVDYGSSQWRCDNVDCGHVFPVSYWLGYKPEGEASDGAVEATYVSLSFADAVDGVYEIAWHKTETLNDGFVKCGADLLGLDAIEAALAQVQVEDRLVAVKLDGNVTLLNRKFVEDLEGGYLAIPSFGEDCSQLYERIEVKPPVESARFDEASLEMGFRIVENESSKLFGVMHADVSYRQILDSSCAVEDWPSLEDQRKALLQFVFDEVSAALPGL